MKRVIVGHRGVGKTTFLERHQIYFPDINHYDLDQAITETTQKKISDIFLREGEKQFRHYELENFNRLIKSDSFVIAVGGGFDPDKIPKDFEVLYISRRTDSDGRIFLDRPKIHSELSDLVDSLMLYESRQEKFLDRADSIYHMPEGISAESEFERKILSDQNFEINAICTITKNIPSEFKYNRIELRSDIFSNSEILKLIHENKTKEIIVSYRTQNQVIQNISDPVIIDWALELGTMPESINASTAIVSVHEGSLQAGIDQLSFYKESHLKLCPVINSWHELIAGYRWQQADKDRRSFLPRTSSGKSDWRWYRILALSFQKINFVQNFIQNDDQPSLYELMNRPLEKNFGAVLGYPIHHSRSPVVQNVIAIPILEKDLITAISFLKELGLSHAAVTSPLKSLAGDLCGMNADFNSLVFKVNETIGYSTDELGFRKVLELAPNYLNNDIAVWGGGGVISALVKVIPDAVYYSARTGSIKTGNPTDDPKVLIWAAPRNNEIKFPADIYSDWKPEMIIDLNYAENSMGIECAKFYKAKNNCKYISGLEMFLEQARYQRIFWKDTL